MKIQKLLNLSKEGCKISQAELLKCLDPLIGASIRRYSDRKEDYDDLVQSGYLFILETLNDYNPKRSVSFTWYMKMRLKYFYLGKNQVIKLESLNRKINNEEEEEEFIDLLASDENLLNKIVKLDEHSILYRAFECLSEREKQVIAYYYIKELSMVEISKKLDLSYRTVVNTKVNALKRLRRFYKKLKDKNHDI